MTDLITKIANRQKDENRRVGASAIGAVAGVGSMYGVNELLNRSIEGNPEDNPADFNKVVDKVGNKKLQHNNLSVHEMPNGKTIVINHTTGSNRNFISREVQKADILKSIPKPYRSQFDKVLPSNKIDVVHLHGKNPTILLHELGHGAGNRSASAKTLRTMAIPAKTLGSYGRAGGAAIPAVAGVLTKRREGESDAEYDKRLRRNMIGSGAATTAILGAGNLAEEARANVNAYRLSKKMGVNLDKLRLAKSYGTYASAFGMPLAAGVAGYGAYRMMDPNKKGMSKTGALIVEKLVKRGNEYLNKTAMVQAPLQGPQQFDMTPQQSQPQGPKDWITAPVSGALIGGTAAASTSKLVNKAAFGKQLLGTKTTMLGAGLGAGVGAALTAMSDSPAH